ncbi:hypothetical protein [Lysinibacillus sp. HST-98]|nr:hypothetical protein [Lysinibacillus sp. HST-98]
MKKYFKILFALSVIFVIGKSFFNMSHAQAEDKISENTDNTLNV